MFFQDSSDAQTQRPWTKELILAIQTSTKYTTPNIRNERGVMIDVSWRVLAGRLILRSQ